MLYPLSYEGGGTRGSLREMACGPLGRSSEPSGR